MTGNSFLKLFGIIAASVVLMAGLINQVQATEKKELVFGLITHVTGAYAATQVGGLEAHMDVIKYLNKINFIPGAKLKGIWVDGGTDVAKSMAGLKKMLAHKPKPVAVHSESTAIGLALKKWFVKNKVPSIEGGNDDKFGQKPSWTFCPHLPYPNKCGAWVDYYVNHLWKDKTRKPRFAWLTWDNAFGRASIRPKVKEYIKSKGVEIVAEEFIPNVPTDTTAQLLRLKEKKVDFTFGGFYTSAFQVVLKDAEKLGIIDDIAFGCSYCAPCDVLPKYVGDSARNVWVLTMWAPESMMEEHAPVIIKAFNEGGYTKIKSRLMYGAGFAVTGLAVEAARIAAEEVGVQNVDGPAVYNGFKKVKNYNGFGLFSPVSFPGGRWYGRDSAILIKYENQKAVYKGIIPAPDLTTKYD